MIDKDIRIEDLVEKYPDSIAFLAEKGIRCIRCGEPVWGSLESAAAEKGFNEKDITKLVEELNRFLKINE
ncbi:MAG: DUF1858 domain-containing protein [Sphingobacteriales bacterium]|nr:DUF1858 domain-containing protein [Sphingobacteriales bacterium]